MNRKDAKKIAETITNEQILEMFKTAKNNIKDWSAHSNVNKGFSKGAAWNILTTAFDVNTNYHILAKINFVREYGEFLPIDLKPVKKEKKTDSNFYHQEPNFDF